MSNFLEKVPGERYLYKSTGGVYYLRRRNEEEDTDQCLDTTNKDTACIARDDYIKEMRLKAKGETVAPAGGEKGEKERKRVMITAILDRYVKAGYPRKKKPRSEGKHLRQEQDSVVLLKQFFKGKYEDELHQDLLDDYHDWRRENVTKGEGDRTTDLELNCLANAIKWAVRKRVITANRIAGRDKFHSQSKARHAKEMAPESPEELHSAVGELFGHWHGETLGWQALIEAATGLRTEETIELRFDAQPGEPGFISGDSMRVLRAEKSDRCNPFVHLHGDLKVILGAHRKWHEKRYPGNPWMCPGRNKAANCHVSKDALTASLDRLFETAQLKRKYISHGMRGFYVLVRRSNGIHDSQIAAELNQNGGLETLRTSYGMVPPHWLDGDGPKLTWLPKDPKKLAWLPLFLKHGI